MGGEDVILKTFHPGHVDDSLCANEVKVLSFLKEKDANGRKNIIRNLDHVTFRDQEYLVLEPLH